MLKNCRQQTQHIIGSKAMVWSAPRQQYSTVSSWVWHEKLTQTFRPSLTMLERAIVTGYSVRLSHSWSTPKRFKISKCFKLHNKATFPVILMPNFVVVSLGGHTNILS